MRIYLALILALGGACAFAQPALKDSWTLHDQFDQAFTLNASTRVVMIARSMSSAKLVNSAVEHTPDGYLDERGVVFVADIERLPSVAQAVLVPAMRTARYRILLDREGSVAPRYGGDRDSVQWLELDHGKVVRERRFSDLPSLRQALAGQTPGR